MMRLMLRLRIKPSINNISKLINSTVLYRKINTSLGMGTKSLGILKNGKVQQHPSVSECQCGGATQIMNTGIGS